MLRPYPGKNVNGLQRNFNYRLSRARRIVECAFGIMASQWKVFNRPIAVKPDTVDWIVKAAVVLHNFQRWGQPPCRSDSELEASPAFVQSGRVGANYASSDALAVREEFSRYFESEAGKIAWGGI